MGQNKRQFPTGVLVTKVDNANLFIDNTETIIINDVEVTGMTNFSTSIKNYSAFGTITNVAVYGSHNGVDYYLIQDELYPNTVLPGHVEYANFFSLTSFIRITATANISGTHIDIYLQCSTM